MILEYASNEFTGNEVLEFVKAAFGRQINGNPFKSYHVNNWIRIGKLPDAYGGYRVLCVEKAKGLHNCKILTLDGLTRDVLEDIRPQPFHTHSIIPNIKLPRKQRTKLYYELLEKSGKQYTRKTRKLATIPDQWKVVGIKRNQLIN